MLFAAADDFAAVATPPREDEPAARRRFGVFAAALVVLFALEDVEGPLERDELGARDFCADGALAGFENTSPGFERDELVALTLDAGFEVHAGGR